MDTETIIAILGVAFGIFGICVGFFTPLIKVFNLGQSLPTKEKVETLETSIGEVSNLLFVHLTEYHRHEFEGSETYRIYLKGL